MKLFTAAQIRSWDAHTLQAQGISSLQLMERASTTCADWLVQRFPTGSLYVVLCGAGNNGGDGLAIARLLQERGYGVKAFLLRHGAPLSPDCEANLQRLLRIDTALVTELQPGTFITDLPPHIIVIDAIMGAGLNRKLEGWLADFVERVNKLPNHKLAIDLPTGISADVVFDTDATVLQVNETLTFQTYKRSLLHPESGRYAGQVHRLDIGLDKGYGETTFSYYHTLEVADVLKLHRPRQQFSHKGTHGTALIVAGSKGTIGAAVLATRAAGRAGAGKVKALVPECGYTILQTTVPEALCDTSGANAIEAIADWESAKGIVIGPGLGQDTATAGALKNFLDACKKPVVLDADALNIIGTNKELIGKIPAGSILTPHPKEFERMFGSTPDSVQRVETARGIAMRHNFHLILKDRYTAIVTPDGEIWYNTSGNAALATGGTGDVLSGILAGLLAQGYDTRSAALLGVYLHGKAAEAITLHHGQEAVVAGDVAEGLGPVFLELQEAKSQSIM